MRMIERERKKAFLGLSFGSTVVVFFVIFSITLSAAIVVVFQFCKQQIYNVSSLISTTLLQRF